MNDDRDPGDEQPELMHSGLLDYMFGMDLANGRDRSVLVISGPYSGTIIPESLEAAAMSAKDNWQQPWIVHVDDWFKSPREIYNLIRPPKFENPAPRSLGPAPRRRFPVPR